ncbi:Uncharacterised protein [Vibrio cholerae]|nr:Uncharacterised protein [Vibrio cholerae]
MPCPDSVTFEYPFYRGLRISVASAKQYSHLRASNH